SGTSAPPTVTLGATGLDMTNVRFGAVSTGTAGGDWKNGASPPSVTCEWHRGHSIARPCHSSGNRPCRPHDGQAGDRAMETPGAAPAWAAGDLRSLSQFIPQAVKVVHGPVGHALAGPEFGHSNRRGRPVPTLGRRLDRREILLVVVAVAAKQEVVQPG